MGEAFGVRCVPHMSGTGVGLATALQLLAVLPNNPPRHTPVEPILEFDRSEHPFRQAVLTSPIEHDGGMCASPMAPVSVYRWIAARWRGLLQIHAGRWQLAPECGMADPPAR